MKVAILYLYLFDVLVVGEVFGTLPAVVCMTPLLLGAWQWLRLETTKGARR